MQRFKAFIALALLIASAVFFSDYIEEVFKTRDSAEAAQAD